MAQLARPVRGGLVGEAGLADDLEVARVQQCDQRLPEPGIVVDDQHLHRERLGEGLASQVGSPSSHVASVRTANGTRYRERGRFVVGGRPQAQLVIPG